MNAMFNTKILQSKSICSEHKIPLIIMFGRESCPTCDIEYVNSSNKEHAKQVNQAVREKHFAGAMLPKRHENSGFRNYTTELPGQKNALLQVSGYAKKIVKGDVTNLVMVGSTGTGKTHLSCATARTLLAKGKFARYITSEDMAQKIMKAWDRESKDQSEASVIYEFTQYDLLILDEYGLHDREKRLELVHKVLYSRYDDAKATMLISNMTLEQLKVDLGDRLWSRFQHGGLTVVECNWNDGRVGGAA
ncbi:ATP-binding protein [Acinetobacter courvalinii]|uniref:ATP-binding protein n=1 Tax=Acinetobacter courvalinii TaxID=280147 RepID=UPI0021D17BA0|nr:ATP-binding protein [Acinetobacter courvalinii]MCU4576108.1 ATP-binding protein [Acinetobacter courvalinii]